MSSLFQIFFSPGVVFEKVRERGHWLLPLLMITLLTPLMVVHVTRTIGADNITRKWFDEHPSLSEKMTPEAREKAIRQSATPQRLAVTATVAAFAAPIGLLVLAVLFMVMLSVMDRKPALGQMLGVVAWSTFPFIVLAFAMSATILFFSKDTSNDDPQNLLGTNIGAYLDKKDVGDFVYSLARSFDILTIGQILLLSYGLSKVSGISMAKAAAILGGLWLIWAVAKGGFAAVFHF